MRGVEKDTISRFTIGAVEMSKVGRSCALGAVLWHLLLRWLDTLDLGHYILVHHMQCLRSIDPEFVGRCGAVPVPVPRLHADVDTGT